MKPLPSPSPKERRSQPTRHNLIQRPLRVVALGLGGVVVLAGLYFLFPSLLNQPPKPVPIITTEDELVAFAEEHLCKPGTVEGITTPTERTFPGDFWSFFCVRKEREGSFDISEPMQVTIYGTNAGPSVTSHPTE